jgi:hypothetical protein
MFADFIVKPQMDVESVPKKVKMTPTEVLGRYRIKMEQLRIGGDRRLVDVVIGKLLSESRWSFKDTMDFIQSQSTTGDAKLSVLISDFLSRDNAQWKYWFFDEFRDVVVDLHLSWHNPRIPYPWLELAITNAHLQRHQDDGLFINVPWRSCYMWTAMFRRRCAKYYADFYLSWEEVVSQTEKDPAYAHARDTVVIKEDSVKVDVLFSQIWHESARSVDYLLSGSEYASLAVRRYEDAYGIVAKAWISWKRMWNWTPHENLSRFIDPLTREKRILVDPNVGVDRFNVQQKRYSYNFTPQTVECFMRWYCDEMSLQGTFPISFEEEEQYPLGVYTFDHDNLSPEIDAEDVRKRTIHGTSMALGFLVIDPKTQEEHWPLLEQLPLCPRRNDTRDPEQRAVQFLGARELGE